MTALRRISAGLLLVSAFFLTATPARGQVRGPRPVQKTISQAQAFYDNIHCPNWLGTDIAHTPIKRQIGGTCWNFATISFLESEVMRANEAVVESLRASETQLDLAEYYVVYWAWVEKAREFVKRKGEGLIRRRGDRIGVSLHDGGLSHDTTFFIRKYGIVPESDYVVPDSSGVMSREIQAVMVDAYEKGDWNERSVVGRVREVLDKRLAPPPERIEVNGVSMSPKEYADEYLKLDYDSYWEITSYTDFPFYTRGELDIPDNWWDYDGYYNVPLDAYIRVINRALDQGYSVAVDTDWGDRWGTREFVGPVGSAFGSLGLAVLHPDMLSPYLIGQQARQSDFEERRTTDDHLVHAVDHRVVDGHDWYLIKNSHGTSSGRRGYVWMRGDYFAMRVLAIMVHKDAIDPLILGRFSPNN